MCVVGCGGFVSCDDMVRTVITHLASQKFSYIIWIQDYEKLRSKMYQQAASIAERDNRLAHYLALFWGFGLLLGYLAISGAKSDGIFFVGKSDFLQRRRYFAQILLSFRDLTFFGSHYLRSTT